MAIADAAITHPCAPQCHKMCAAAQCLAYVAGKSPDVSALAAHYAQRRPRHGEVEQFYFVNDELLAAVGRLTGEYGKIGGNLNQIARYLNEYGAPYNTLAAEVRAELSDLAALKFQVLREVGEAIGNTETFKL